MAKLERELGRQRSQEAEKAAAAERRLKRLNAAEEQSTAEAKDTKTNRIENELKGPPTSSDVAASEARYRRLERAAKDSTSTQTDAGSDARQESDHQTIGEPRAFTKFGELEPNTQYERNGYIYQTDHLGRVTTVQGKLELAAGDRTYHQTEVGKQGRDGDEGGHLIATRFGGSPEGMNLVPQNANLNRGDWKRLENRWGEALDEGQEVEVVISIDYSDNSSRPAGFYVWERIGSKEHEHYLENEPQGELKGFEE